VVIIVLFAIIIITATITTAVKEAAIVILNAVLFGVGGVGYLRVLHRAVAQSACSLPKVETVHATCWCRCAACCGPGVVTLYVAKVKKAGHLPTACWGPMA